MNIKINIYTSFYKKMLQRHKNENDFYVQVSRNLFMPVKGVDNVSMNEMIDFNLGDVFGMFFATLEEYEEFLRQPDMKENLDELVTIFSADSLDISENELLEVFKGLSPKEKEQFAEIGMTEEECTFNFYLLCYEDLESCYTEKDEAKHSECKAGTKKKCHRTILAKVLNDLYNLSIQEF